jgi:hypothetical protein
MKTELTHRVETRTVTDLVKLYEAGELNLEPSFQRQSVWKEPQRRKLIDSILHNLPIPAIFVYRREEEGDICYDVIDGKQRLESIFKFMGKMSGRFWVKAELPNADAAEWLNWHHLCKHQKQYLLTGYKIPVIEVDGEIGDIINIFVRINSTGTALTKQEKRHAMFQHSRFLQKAAELAGRYEDYFVDMGILGAAQISRMKHIELICELMLSIHTGDVINKKAALDKVMQSNGLTDGQVKKAVAQTVTALNRVKKMFPKLYATRLSKLTDFYSLTVLVAKFENERLILTDRRRNKLAWDLLSAFAIKVDEVREKQRKAIGTKPEEGVFREYLLTVSQMTDDVNQRRKREAILRGLLESIFAKKDSQRGFTPEQRRILWNTASSRKCEECNRVLNWDDFTIDHIDPYSKGGRSRLENSALMCRSCNSSKGNRKRR